MSGAWTKLAEDTDAAALVTLRVDPALGRWLRWCIDAAPVVISADEELAVMECMTAMLWAIAAADLAGVSPELADQMIA